MARRTGVRFPAPPQRGVYNTCETMTQSEVPALSGAGDLGGTARGPSGVFRRAFGVRGWSVRGFQRFFSAVPPQVLVTGPLLEQHRAESPLRLASSVPCGVMDPLDTGQRFGVARTSVRPWPPRVIAGWALTLIGLVAWHWLWSPVLVAVAVALLVAASKKSSGGSWPHIDASDGALPPGSWEPVVPPHPHRPQD